MSAVTKIKLTSNPTLEEAVEYLSSLDAFRNVEIAHRMKPQTYTYAAEGDERTETMPASGFVEFEYYNERMKRWEGRNMFFLEDYADKSPESSDPPFLPQNHLYFSGVADSGSVDIGHILARKFGGHILHNDCGSGHFDSIEAE